MSTTPAQPTAPDPGRRPAPPTPPPPPVQDRLVLAHGVLTLITGLVDATCYLGLGRVFTANMTGNVVLLGFGLARAGGLPILAPIVSLALFLTGAFAFGHLAPTSPDPHRRLTTALGAELVLVIAAIVVTALAAGTGHGFGHGGDIGSTGRYVAIGALAAAFGIQNAAVRLLGVADMTTTVLTRTLTGLASDRSGPGGPPAHQRRRIASVLLLFGGALGGALLLRIGLVWPLVAAAAGCVAALLVVLPRHPSTAAPTPPPPTPPPPPPLPTPPA
jgi:uncharacterized membrane protein YoaK (UPF0700 family)